MYWIVILIVCLLFFLVWASAYIGSNVYVKALCSVRTQEKILALTFDDGIHPIYTPKVLDVLDRYNAQATFFIIGKNIEGNEALLRDMVRRGHCIGNHTYNHTSYFPLLTTSRMIEEIEQCSKKIEEVTHEKTLLFRPPFGVTNPTIGAAIRTLHLKTIGWSIRSYDTISSKSRESIADKVTQKLHPGGIVLLHDRCEQADALLEEILKRGIAQGYRFVTINQLNNSI